MRYAEKFRRGGRTKGFFSTVSRQKKTHIKQKISPLASYGFKGFFLMSKERIQP